MQLGKLSRPARPNTNRPLANNKIRPFRAESRSARDPKKWPTGLVDAHLAAKLRLRQHTVDDALVDRSRASQLDLYFGGLDFTRREKRMIDIDRNLHALADCR